MKTFRNYLLALTLVVAAFSFAACGNNDVGETTSMESTTAYNETTNGGNSGIINDTTQKDDNNGVIDDIGDDVESGVNDVLDDAENDNTTMKK